jgi:HD-GYP domain-containing protein (c-di-GMP phosphodiesterase class II)
MAALLHDIGKAGIPHNVLMKPSSLNEDEWRVIKMHPVLGWEMLSRVAGAADEAEIVYCHHEHFDGSGYPRGLKQDEIPIGARVFALADTMDAIVSNRPYRGGQPLSAARQEIARGSGSQFEPDIVRAFERIPDEQLEAVQYRFKDKEDSPS